MTISGKPYVRQMLKYHGEEDIVPRATPFEDVKVAALELIPPGQPSDPNDPDVPTTRYKSLLGSLQYSATTAHPETSMILSYLGKFAPRPRDSHFQCLRRVLAYVKYAWEKCIRYDASKEFIYFAADSDWAGCPFTRYSRYGHVVFMLGAPVAWCSKLGKRTARSSCEAEYYAIAECVSEMIFFCDLIDEVYASPPLPFTLLDDNVSTEALLRDQMRPTLARHVDIDYRYAQDEYFAGTFDICYIPGTDNVADVFTKFKGYTAESFTKFADALFPAEEP